VGLFSRFLDQEGKTQYLERVRRPEGREYTQKKREEKYKNIASDKIENSGRAGSRTLKEERGGKIKLQKGYIRKEGRKEKLEDKQHLY